MYTVYAQVFGQIGLNSVDPDQMLRNAASDLGLYCLPCHWTSHKQTGQ